MALRLTHTATAFLRLVRWQNLIIVAGCLTVFHRVLTQFKQPAQPLLLDGFPFLVFITSALCITASGYLINDHFDRSTDAINRPERLSDYQHIRPFSAIQLFFLINLAGLVVSIWLAWVLNQWQWLPLYPLITCSLAVYTIYLKGAGWWGNLWVALLSGSLHWVLLLPEMAWLNSLDTTARQELFMIFIGFSALGIVLSFFREIVKDMEDQEGDLLANWQTGAVRKGLPTARLLATGVGGLTIGLLFLATVWMASGWVSQVLFGLAATIVIRLLWLLQSARRKEEFHHISQGAKLVLFIGLLAVLSL